MMKGFVDQLHKFERVFFQKLGQKTRFQSIINPFVDKNTLKIYF